MHGFIVVRYLPTKRLKLKNRTSNCGTRNVQTKPARIRKEPEITVTLHENRLHIALEIGPTTQIDKSPATTRIGGSRY